MNVKKLNWWLGGGLPGFGEVFFQSTDRAIAAGGDGGADYLSFGDIAEDPINGRLYVSYHKDTQHASFSTATIGLIVSDNQFATQATEILISTSASGYNNTNSNCFVGNNRRLFVTWTKIGTQTGAELSGSGEIWYKYSDDIYSVADPTTATWSSELRLTLDYGKLYTTSATSINLNTITGATSVTIATGLTGIVLGRIVKIASRSDFNKWVQGTVTGYVSGTGVLSFTVTTKQGTTTHTDWDVSLTSYIDGPGAAILIGTDLWKPVWTTTGGTSSVMIYSSSDNGATWSYHSTITADALNPCDETCIVRLPNGDVMAFIRCNTLSLMRTSRYTSGAWQALVTTNISSEGKNPVALSPQGNVIGLGRDRVGSPVDRTIYFWNTDSTYTTWASDFIDERYKYMYGGILWSTLQNKFIAQYAVESVNEVTALQGPTILIRKYLTRADSPPTQYNTSMRDLLDFGQGNYETLPNEALYDYYNDYFNGLVTDGMLAEHDFIFMLMQNNASVQAFSCRNWRKGWEVLTQVATPTYSVNGFDFNGTTQYLQYKALNTLTKFTLNNGSMSCYVGQNVVEAGGAFGSGDGTFGSYTNATWLRPRVVDTLEYAQFGVNQNFAGPVSSYAGSVLNSNSIGFWKISRTGANTSKLHKDNSLLLTNSTTASTGRSGRPLLIGAVNFAVTPNHFGTKLVGYIDGGSAMDGYESGKFTRFNTFKTAIGL